MGTKFNDVLHTYSIYGPNDYEPRLNDVGKQRDNLRTNIEQLQAKEKAFYTMVLGKPIHSFEEFLAEIKERLKQFEQDKTALQQLDNDKLTQALSRKYGFSTKGRWIQNENNFSRIIVRLDPSEAEKTVEEYTKDIIKAVKDGLKKIGTFTEGKKGDFTLQVADGSTKEKFIIDFGLNTDAINKGLNDVALLKSVVNVTLKRNLNVEAQSLEWFKNKILDTDNLISFTTHKREFVWEQGSKLRTKDKNGKTNPFAIKKSGLAEKDKDQQKQIENEIKAFIKQTIGYDKTSTDFQAAFDLAWYTQISKQDLGIAGYTWNGAIANIVGAFGEFQTYVLFKYVARLFGKKIQGQIADAFIKGEQLKADVRFFNNFGIQVKNYTGYGTELKKFKFNIHPDKLVQYPQVSEWIGSSFLEYIANYYFNKDIYRAPFGMIIEGLKSAFAEIASMGTTRFVQDTVCLYNLGNGYLIPASELLKKVYSQGTQLDETQVSITSAYEGLTNEEYHKIITNKEGERVAAFSPYWEMGKKHTWKPTPKNRILYSQLIHSRISIRAVVPFDQFRLEEYNLWR